MRITSSLAHSFVFTKSPLKLHGKLDTKSTDKAIYVAYKNKLRQKYLA
jgi:hypothetical protein